MFDGPEKCIIFCATNRSGSSMVFDDFRNLAGYPPYQSETLFEEIILKKTAKSWREIWPELRGPSEVKGYFVDKVMFHHLPDLSRFMAGGSVIEAPGDYEFSPELVDAFQAFFRRAIWVSLERRDVFAQAVSLYLANATNVWWHSHEDPYEDPRHASVKYDFAKLKELYVHLVAERESWRRFFRHYSLAPIRIEYEYAAENYPGYLAELFVRAGLKMAPQYPTRRMVKIGDAVNEQYARRLREDVLSETKAEHRT